MTGITSQELHPTFRDELFKEVPAEVLLASRNITVTSPIKTPVKVKRIDGKTVVNLVPLFDSGALLSKASTTEIKAPNEMLIKDSVAFGYDGGFKFPVKPNTTYTLKMDVLVEAGGDYFFIRSNNESANLLGGSYIGYGNNGAQVTTKADTTVLHLIFSSNIAGSRITYKNVMITEGTQAFPYVANIKGVTNPTIKNEDNDTSLVIPTTLYAGEYVEQNDQGKLVKFKKFQEKVMDDQLTYSLKAIGAGDHKIIIVPFSELGNVKSTSLFANNAYMVKYDGSMMHQGTGSGLNYFNVANNGTDLSINVPNVDSGWGVNYNPTPAEIKAYFLGWRMNVYEGGVAPYNGTGVKEWHRINGGSVIGGSGTRTLPTTQIPIHAGWQPYRLIYELSTPVRETVRPYGNLLLNADQNSLTVYAGRIVDEKIVPGRYGEGYYINGNIQPRKLRYRNAYMLGVYSNGEMDNRWNLVNTLPGDVPVYGVYQAVGSASWFDPMATYTVDYEPMYLWEVTAPVESIKIEYHTSLQGLLGALAEAHKNDQDVLKRLLIRAISSEQGLIALTITTLNMSSGYIICTKDALGYVNVNVYFASGVWNQGALIGVLPEGFRPGFWRALMSSATNITPFSSTGYFIINTSGQIILAHGTPIAHGTNLVDANIVGTALYRAGN